MEDILEDILKTNIKIDIQRKELGSDGRTLYGMRKGARSQCVRQWRIRHLFWSARPEPCHFSFWNLLMSVLYPSSILCIPSHYKQSRIQLLVCLSLAIKSWFAFIALLIVWTPSYKFVPLGMVFGNKDSSSTFQHHLPHFDVCPSILMTCLHI